MSKSKGNVVDPDEIIQNYGADTARLFILFAAPPAKDLEWNSQGVEGCSRFLKRVWRIFDDFFNEIKSAGPIPEGYETEVQELRKLRRLTHLTIRRVTNDIQTRMQFNTAISAIMELVNHLYVFRDEWVSFKKDGDEVSRALLTDGSGDLHRSRSAGNSTCGTGSNPCPTYRCGFTFLSREFTPCWTFRSLSLSASFKGVILPLLWARGGC
mgnify:CR=1 FL=1